VKIKRHRIPNMDNCREVLRLDWDSLQEYVRTARLDGTKLFLLCDMLPRMVQCGVVVATDSPPVVPWLRLAAQAHAALFGTGAAKGNRVVVHLGEGEPVTYESSVPHEGFLSAYRWIDGFFLAALCRDKASMDLLCRTPAEIIRQSSTTFPEYKYLFVEALQGFGKNEAATAERLLAAMRATDPEQFGDHRTKVFVDYALAIDVNLIRLLFFVYGNDGEFAKGLELALKQHKEYWSKKSRQNNWTGFVSIHLCAVAALAYDRGLRFDVESDYLPMPWVTGEAFGELGGGRGQKE
jgi:hypothetical protein